MKQIILLLIILFVYSCDTFDKRREQWKEHENQTKENIAETDTNRNDSPSPKDSQTDRTQNTPINRDTIERILNEIRNRHRDTVYYVITNSLSNISDAEQRIAELKNMGYVDATTLPEENGKIRISVKSFTSNQNVNEYLIQIRHELTKDAWILKKEKK